MMNKAGGNAGSHVERVEKQDDEGRLEERLLCEREKIMVGWKKDPSMNAMKRIKINRHRHHGLQAETV